MAYEVEKVMAIYSKLYEELDAEEEGPMVAAILTACAVAEDICERMVENFSHQLALGIRHGLFGKNASATASIASPTDPGFTCPYEGCVCAG
ncbi:MAG: hypothetical protein DRP46_14305 [Candidatus Zixiibacteriota bacterium]|nr:MAG: hypothetical protein DRP46_14305 [candidate division Zixibacteria bacterium]